MTLLIVLFFLVLTLTSTIVMMVTGRSRSLTSLKSRLAEIRNPGRRVEVATTLDHDLTASRQLTSNQRVTIFLEQFAAGKKITTLLTQSRSKLSLGSFFFVSLVTSSFAGVVAAVFCSQLALVALIALLGLAFPFAWLLRVRSRLLYSFGQGLPDAIELMARALRAGHSVQQAMELIAEQSPEPLSGEFAKVHQEQRFGIPFREALLQMSSRVPSKDLRFFVTAILVQKETGSDLIEILDRTTTVIRDRVRVDGEVRTYTAQGRLTGWILCLLPFILLALISLMSPGYAAPLFHDPVGQKLLLAGCGMIVIGCFIIQRIVAVEV